MPPLGFHLVFRARDSRVIAPDVGAQRTLAVTLHRIGERYGLCAFRASGDHLHTANLCDRAAAGAFAQAVGSALTQTLGISTGFGSTFLKPMLDQPHVEEVFAYIHRNAEKHGVGNDPTHEASSIQALLGLRVAPSPFIPRVRARLPRVHRGQLLKLLGVAELAPMVRIDLLADAAAGAVGLAHLDDTAPAVRARQAAVRLALPTVPLGAVADALALSERTTRRYRSTDADPSLERMIALRMGHRAALGDRARTDLPPLARGA
ncbi:MAG: hypothetical protein Q8P18_09550 [Pseudomonadota bacterium]|nr:hypothetical protein [Pseudomonadota bacterium]